MDRNLWSYDLSTLKDLYEEEAAALKTALIGGASWEETRDQRNKVTELAIAIHKKRSGPDRNPAENSIRDDPEAS